MKFISKCVRFRVKCLIFRVKCVRIKVKCVRFIAKCIRFISKCLRFKVKWAQFQLIAFDIEIPGRIHKAKETKGNPRHFTPDRFKKPVRFEKFQPQV